MGTSFISTAGESDLVVYADSIQLSAWDDRLRCVECIREKNADIYREKREINGSYRTVNK